VNHNMTPQQLKNSILQFAIQGKLVEQRPEEGTGAELYKEIQAEKKRLVKAGKLEKEKPLPEISEDEIPFDIPESWVWVTLSDLGSFSSGKTPNMATPEYWQNGNVQWFTSKDMKSKYLSESELKITELAAKDMTHYPAGTLLLVVRSGILKRMLPICILTCESTINQDIKAYRLYDLRMSDYVYYVLKGLEYIVLNQYTKRVTTVDSLKFDEFSKQMPIPLPPLAEQRRIVEKIESLLPFIDRYAEAWKRLEAFNTRFPLDMRKSLLQLAIQGKLVEQRAEEGTGEELYREIQKEKKKLITEGKLKKDKPLPEITEDEIPFDIPESWKWVRFGSILNNLVDGTHRTPKYTPSGIPFVSVKNMSSGILSLADTKYITVEEHQELSKRCNPQKGDILLSKVGTTGIPAKVNTDKEFSLFVSVALLKFDHTLIDIDFLIDAILTPDFQKQCREHTRGVGNKNWVIQDIANTIVPLPPLAEQKRIVAKLNEMLPLCEGLKG